MQSFCRKTTLTKHQHRSHHKLSVTRAPSEDINSEVSYLIPVTTPDLPSNQPHPAQLPCYSNIAIATPDWSTIQNLPMTSVAGWAQPSAVLCNNPVSPFLEVQHAGQWGHLQFVPQQQSGQHYTGYFPADYQPPYAQLAVEDRPLGVLYAGRYQYSGL
jgi:hypothetical protein